MRSVIFNVPKRGIKQVASFIGENEIKNSIDGLNDDSEIILSVDYEKDESETIDELEALIDSFYAPEEEEEEPEEA